DHGRGRRAHRRVGHRHRARAARSGPGPGQPAGRCALRGQGRRPRRRQGRGGHRGPRRRDHPRQAVLAAGGRVVLEEFLDGPGVSLCGVSDGTRVVPLAPAQDFKRALDDDEGPNTGGMGAYSPLPWAPEGLTEEVLDTVARPTIAELAGRGTPFVGVLYCGLALTSRGLRVVAFNARFGDPETQVVLERLTSPFAPLLLAAARGELADGTELTWSEQAAVTVVLACAGYPAAVC